MHKHSIDHHRGINRIFAEGTFLMFEGGGGKNLNPLIFSSDFNHFRAKI